MMLLIGLLAVLLGCFGIVILMGLQHSAVRKKENEESLLYELAVLEFYEMIDESPNDVPVPYDNYQDMKRLIDRMRKSIPT